MPKEMNEFVRTAYTAIDRFVNGGTQDDFRELAELLASNHRTLQQNTMRLFMEFVGQMQQHYLGDWHDPRNEASCLLAQRIMEIPERDRALPRI